MRQSEITKNLKKIDMKNNLMNQKIKSWRMTAKNKFYSKNKKKASRKRKKEINLPNKNANKRKRKRKNKKKEKNRNKKKVKNKRVGQEKHKKS